MKHTLFQSVLVLYVVNSTIISIPFVLFPCKGFYVRGLGHYIGLSAHGGLVSLFQFDILTLSESKNQWVSSYRTGDLHESFLWRVYLV